MQIQLLTFLSLQLDGANEQLRVAVALLFPGKNSGTHWMSGQAGSTTGLDAIVMPYRESNIDSPTNSAYPIHYTDWAIYTDYWTRPQIQFNAHLDPMMYFIQSVRPSIQPPAQTQTLVWPYCKSSVGFGDFNTFTDSKCRRIKFALTAIQKTAAESMCCDFEKIWTWAAEGC